MRLVFLSPCVQPGVLGCKQGSRRHLHVLSAQSGRHSRRLELQLAGVPTAMPQGHDNPASIANMTRHSGGGSPAPRDPDEPTAQT